VGGVRFRSQSSLPGRPAAGKAVAAGCLALLIFAALILGIVAVLKLLHISGSWPYAMLWAPLVSVIYWILAWYSFHWYRDDWRWQWRRRRQLALAAIFWGYLSPFVAVLTMMLATIHFGTTWSAAHGGGHPGTLQVQQHRCHRSSCSWKGRFQSDDGAVIRESVTMRDDVPAGTRAGDQLRARDTGDRTYVFAESGSFGWSYPLYGMALSGAYLLGWGFFVVLIGRWRLRRHRGSRRG